jgi:hypothetical protein
MNALVYSYDFVNLLGTPLKIGISPSLIKLGSAVHDERVGAFSPLKKRKFEYEDEEKEEEDEEDDEEEEDFEPSRKKLSLFGSAMEQAWEDEEDDWEFDIGVLLATSPGEVVWNPNKEELDEIKLADWETLARWFEAMED